MNVPVIKKPENKNNAKPDTTKTIADQKKVISQLKQEIKNLNNAIKDMQHKPETQSFIITIPQELFIKLNAYLLDYERDVGETVSLSELITDAIDIYLYSAEQNDRIEEEDRKAEKDKSQE